MKLQSLAFTDQGAIPRKYTCQGEDCSPPLSFSDVPKETKTLALIVEDPDVPEWVRKDRLWVHWVVYNLPPNLKGLDENQKVPGLLGLNTSGKAKYMGPCPPDREHRYFFTLYALSKKIELPVGARKEEVLKEMEGHILAKAQLIGLYEQTPE